MLTDRQAKEIKEHLERAQNPLFFFDNDQDGLCSFLLLQRYLERGKGVPVKSFPDLNVDYFRKVKELNTDYIFILDKPIVSGEFFEKVRELNIPVVWIDHHEINLEDIPGFVDYYNPLYNKIKTSEPVTALCYQITQRREDLWLAIVGCISDKFLPDFYNDFQEDYPELCINSKEPFEIFYRSDIGKVARIIGLGLKDATTNVVRMLKFLIKSKSPLEVLEDRKDNKSFRKRFEEINSKIKKLVSKAIDGMDEDSKLIYFEYGGPMSVSADLSNQLHFMFPEKIIVVVYFTGAKRNISARGKRVKQIILKSIEGLENSRGGGHDEAVGAQVMENELERFKENLFSLVGNS